MARPTSARPPTSPATTETTIPTVPSFAELAGATIPADYAIDGESFRPWLTGAQPSYRNWGYGYKSQMQLIRGDLVMKDGHNRWWDVSEFPEDLISFPQIKDWAAVSERHRSQRERLLKVLPQFDNHAIARDAPGVPPGPKKPKKSKKKK